MKIEGCYDLDDYSALNPLQLPATYSTNLTVGYELNYIADQDGNVDENCTRAFINRIVTKEQFGYIDCMEDKIHFHNFLSDLLTEMATSLPFNDILTVMKNVAVDTKSNIAAITNEQVYKTLDITSGIYNLQKTLQTELFQFQSIPLYSDNKFLEGFELECTKEVGGFSIKLKAKILTLRVIIQKLPGNAPSVELSATCD